MVTFETKMSDELKVSMVSYNSRGFTSTKQQYTKELLSKCQCFFAGALAL